MGLIKLTPAGYSIWKANYESLTEQEKMSYDITKFLNLLLKKNIRISTVAFDGSWGEVDSIEDLELYEEMIKEGKIRMVPNRKN